MAPGAGHCISLKTRAVHGDSTSIEAGQTPHPTHGHAAHAHPTHGHPTPHGHPKEDAALSPAARELRDFISRKEGNALRAWCKYFDTDNDQKISLTEFLRGMRKMGYTGDATAIFMTLDSDRSGELSLEELDSLSAACWQQFRCWCVSTFEDSKEMVQRIGVPEVIVDERFAGLKSIPGPANIVITQQSFIEGVQKQGWSGGYEVIIFSAINKDDKPAINEDDLQWLEIEKRRQKRKEMAKRKAMAEHKRSNFPREQISEVAMHDFKQFLKRKHGNLIKAWLSALSPDGAMVLQRNLLFKACSNMGWNGDVRTLYKGFDKDDSGYISIEELDMRSAEILAHFRVFTEQKFGSASATFRALDKFNQKKLREQEFVSALKSFGFKHSAKVIFHGLDHRGFKALVEEDLAFLDRWKPRAFLTSTANSQALEDLKALLLKEKKTYLKAWRHLLDVDSSNRCNYDEFEAACKEINFKGEIAGAWRALDEDGSGYISLFEIDPVSSRSLEDFRKWCDEEFGSVRSAFGVFDVTGDNEVSYREWRRSLRIYGFSGNASALFHALDVERNGSLSLNEVDFLDEWVFAQKEGEQQKGVEATPELIGLVKHDTTQMTMEYVTDGPGPGAYRLPPSMGCGPMVPSVHFSGAFSFSRRPQAGHHPGLNKDAALIPSPCQYDNSNGIIATSPSKPAWQFGKEHRHVVDKLPGPDPLSGPGPGQYSPVLGRGRAVAFTPRRPLKVHPLFRDFGLRSPREVNLTPRVSDMEALQTQF